VLPTIWSKEQLSTAGPVAVPDETAVPELVSVRVREGSVHPARSSTTVSKRTKGRIRINNGEELCLLLHMEGDSIPVLGVIKKNESPYNINFQINYLFIFKNAVLRLGFSISK
jgi:hypothetical protein